MSRAIANGEHECGPDEHCERAQDTTPFGSNEIRLTPRQWLLALSTLVVLAHVLPSTWRWIEPFDPGPDYRIPYSLGEDYWLYDRWCRQAADTDATLLVGDSVVWGHYVTNRQTLSHYLSQLSGRPFANLGVDGIHPAAMVGLIEHYARALKGRRVLLHCNLLWMSSARHDLQQDEESQFNHPRLVPQFFPRIPCYRESLANKLSNVVERNVAVFGWANHVRAAYFGNSDLGSWTLEHPYDSPFRALTLRLPSPDGPPPEHAKPWTQRGIEMFSPVWVELDTSLQWRCFRRTVEILRARGNRIFVLIGPFNEHMLQDQSRLAYQQRKAEVAAWLARAGVAYLVAPVLPSELYADASHPLADGYAMLAAELLKSPAFTLVEDLGS